MTPTVVLLVHAAFTWALVGLIWTVQVVHYPLLAKIGPGEFQAVHDLHVRRITFVVAPLMIGELLTGAWLLVHPPGGTCPPVPLLGMALLAVVWLSTLVLQAPCHRRLERGFDPATHRALVRTNWVRTLVWSARGGLVLAWLLATV